MKRILLLTLLLLCVAAIVEAHHGLASEYDRDEVITIKEAGRDRLAKSTPVLLYQLEVGRRGDAMELVTATPNMLVRYPGGWTRDKVFARLNDEITVKGWQAKDGTNHLYGDMLTFSDGSTMKWEVDWAWYEQPSFLPASIPALACTFGLAIPGAAQNGAIPRDGKGRAHLSGIWMRGGGGGNGMNSSVQTRRLGRTSGVSKARRRR